MSASFLFLYIAKIRSNIHASKFEVALTCKNLLKQRKLFLCPEKLHYYITFITLSIFNMYKQNLIDKAYINMLYINIIYIIVIN